MRFGVSLAQLTSVDGPVEWCLDVARRADQLGYDSIWVDDRIAPPAPASNYEALTLVSAIAAITTRAQVGAVLALPFRHPVIVAKMLAAADLIGDGRVALGVDPGSDEAEFSALGLPAGTFEQRDQVTDDYLLAIKEMWLSTGPSNFSSEHVTFSDVGTFPKPYRRPHPPIVVAGPGRAAMVRASRHGTGYLSSTLDPAELAAEVDELRGICRSDRRDPAEIEIYLQTSVRLVPGGADSSGRALLTGSADQLAADLLRYGAAGVDHLIIAPDASPPDRRATMIDALEAFATEILPAFAPSRASAALARP
jgi:alkanesulfonate monooxygenase SsuD/methylene tetrahydromethanopterin reductase-like flavin-dependent oxidoreductase (luciferase family)